MSYYTWYKDTFSSKVTLRKTSLLAFGKKLRFIARLQNYFFEKDKNKFSKTLRHSISYHILTYWQIHNIIVDTGVWHV